MGLFGRKKKKDLLYEGVTGTAVVKAMGDELHPHTDDDSFHLSELGIGNALYPLVLEVTPDDGRAPYRVDGRFKVPAKIGMLGVGSSLPVYLDPADSSVIEINWDGYVASGAAEVPGFDPSLVHDAFPDASRNMMVSGWTAAVKGGQMSRDDFDDAIADAVKGGLLTQAEADTAKASLG